MTSRRSLRQGRPFLVAERVGTGAAGLGPEPGWSPAGAAGVAVAILAAGALSAALATRLVAGSAGVPEAGAVALGSLESRLSLTLAAYFAAFALTMGPLTWLAALRCPEGARAGLALGAPAQGLGAYAGAGAATVIAATIFVAALMVFNPEALASEAGNYRIYLTARPGWLLALVLCVLTPVAEEMLFRGFLFPHLARSRLDVAGAAVATSLIWAVLHLDRAPAARAVLFLFGLFLSWTLVRTGSLRVPMFCHMLFNGGLSMALLISGWPV